MSHKLAGEQLVLLLGALCLLALPSRAAQSPAQLKPQGYVNDFANVLSPSARDQLTALCAELDHKAQAQISIVTIHSLGGRPIEDYSIDLATRWGIGPKQKDRGVLILLAVDDHKYRFEVGYGLEGILPDGKVGGFGREAVPFLRQNNYDAAVLLMTRRVAGVIAADRGVTLAQQTPVAPPPTSGERLHNEAPSSQTQLIIALILLAIIFRIIRAVTFAGTPTRYRRSGGLWLPLMLGGFGRGGFGGGGWGGGHFGGGGFLGGGGSGGSFGGFGGGSFGGGGASGSW